MNKNKLIAMMVVPAVIAPSVAHAQTITNYSLDEKEIRDFSEDNRYRDTQMPQGDGVSMSLTDKEKSKEFVEGFKYITAEPSKDLKDRTKWGVEIEFDKEKSQRTYTDFSFSNSDKLNAYLEPGSVSSKEVGERLSSDKSFKDVTYKAQSDIEIIGSRSQRNLNLYANEEDLRYINDKDNKNITMAWQGKYSQDPTIQDLRATEGPSTTFSFTVNPWPNENDELAPLKLNKTYDKKEYVKGQDIKTDIKIDNLDENAKERLVGQVYNPSTGKVVKEAETYLDEDGFVHVKLPEGVINEDGTENKDSIFNTPEYKGLQNLDVKFFARPRTTEEFKNIVKKREEELGSAGTYTETGAGSKFINHKGKEVEVDLQGIDRYDHYNLVGSFKLQLDDTRYYDQNFIGSDKEDTEKHTSIPILPGQDFNVKAYLPEDKKNNPYQKSDLDIKDDKEKGNLIAKLDKRFINKQNEDKKEEDKWKITGDEYTNFTVTAPKSAKSGDFIAIPLEYTYTNGSKDTHWFHFVVQETDNNKPEYFAKVGLRGSTLTNKPTLPDDEISLKKRQPVSYELLDTNTFKDDKGNTWLNPKIDEKTGEITIDVPKENIEGGENIFVDVKVNYLDENGETHYEIVKAQFVAKAKYEGTFTYEEEQEIAFETKVELDDSLPAGEQKITQEGKAGTKSRTITQKY